MAQVRIPVFSKLVELSKWSAAQRDAYKAKEVYDVGVDEVVTLTTLPDVINIPNQDNSSTAITLPTEPKDDGKTITVINSDASEAVSVGGVSCVADTKTVIRQVAGSWAKLYAVTLV